MSKLKSVVLLSSGLDSTVNLYAARKQGNVLLALTFDYGQRAAKQEIRHSQKITGNLKVPHLVVRIPFLKDLGNSSLTNRAQKIPSGRQVQIADLKVSQKSAKAVWVPNRNGIFLNIAAAYAESLGAQLVIPGFNVEEAATFPDNSLGFLKALDQSFSYSTANQVKAYCFTTGLNKTQIVKLGNKLRVDWSQIWPCYHHRAKWCGQCESCQRSLRALRAQKVDYSRYVLGGA